MYTNFQFLKKLKICAHAIIVRKRWTFKILQTDGFTGDLDFACGKIPKFTSKQFFEFGKEFSDLFIDTMDRMFNISVHNIEIKEFQSEKIYKIYSEKFERCVASWIITMTIPRNIFNKKLNNDARRSERRKFF